MTTGKKIVYTFLAAMVPTLLLAFSTGPDVRYTGGPGDSHFACATAGCHTGSPTGGPINSFAGFGVTATFSTGSTYTPGQPVTITVNVTDPVNTLHGFQMSARMGSSDAQLAVQQAGRFSFTGSGLLVLCDNNVPRTPSGNCPANFPVEFIEHNAPRTGTWTFTWTPPATDQGPVHFYIAGNAVNGDGINDAQDHVYTASYVLQTATGTPPSITEARGIEGWGGATTFSNGSWLQIKGSNFTDVAFRQWVYPDDFNGQNAPTSLGGVSVSINNKPAFVNFISPGQVNVAVPDDPAVGPVSVTVSGATGVSNTFSAQKVAAAPGLLAPPSTFPFSFFVNGKQYLEATLGVSTTFIGNPNFVANFPFPFVPAKPGDSVLLYGIGFGDVNPPLPAGVVAGSDKIAAPLTISFDQTPATINYSGHYPSFIGLYLLAVTVPDVPDGDHQIIVNLNGQQLPQTVFLTVHR